MQKATSFNLLNTLLFVLIIPFDSHAEEPIKKGDFFTLENCIEIALKENPSSVADENTVIAAQSRINQAVETLEFANSRYTGGIGNPIEVTDAMVAYNNPKTAYIQVLYDYKVDRASLEKAMGEG